jgi:pyruvate formate lyase activating enzyme
MKTPNPDDKYKLARYQDKKTDGTVRCLLCPHVCLLHDNETGLCHVRKNLEGTLFTMAYGNPCSANLDPIEKKPLFHFYPGKNILSLAIAGCNFHCSNCQNWQISQVSPEELPHFRLNPQKIIDTTLSNSSNLIAFTYTEPTIFYEYMYDIAVLAHEKGIKTVMVSNGYINRDPLIDLCPYLDAANVDLKCFDNDSYKQLTTGSLHPVLQTLKTLKEKNIWLEITNLLIPNYNDSAEMIGKMCTWLAENGFSETPLHFSRFFPTYQLTDRPETSEKSLHEAKKIAEQAGIKYVYIGNIQHTQGENTFCPNCHNLLVERQGFNVVENLITKGKCNICGETIAGVWE